MRARHAQAEAAQVRGPEAQPKAARSPFADRFGDFEVGLRAVSVGDRAALHQRHNTLHVGVVEAQDRRAVERNLVDELDEGGPDVVDGAVAIEVLAIYIGYHRHDGRELQKGAVALVGLYYQKVAVTHTCV